MIGPTVLVWSLLALIISSQSFALTSIGHRLFSAKFLGVVEYSQKEFNQVLKNTRVSEDLTEIKIIKNQTKFLTGYLSHLSGKASLLGNAQIEVVSRDQNQITYQYSGKFLLPESFSTEKSMPAFLPRSVEKLTSLIYADQEGVNPEFDKCTNRHYSSSDFWYFYNPHNKKCSLMLDANRENLLPIEIELNLETEEGRVGADELAIHKFSKDKSQIDISVFFAPSSDSSRLQIPGKILDKNFNQESHRKFKTLNDNLKQYLKLRNRLIENGFQQKKLTILERFKLLDGDFISGNPMIEDFVLQLKNQSIRVRLLTARSSSDLNRYSQFSSMWANSLKASDVIIYNGHSGLGGNLSLENMANSMDIEIDELQYDKNNYQLVFLNGCATFVHYLSIYQEFRPSQMDLILNGVSASFSSMGDSSYATVKFVERLIQSESHLSIIELLKELPVGQLPVFIPARTETN